MLITRRSKISGIERTLEIPCTIAQYDAYVSGELIQKAMPDLTPDEREFIISGITAEEWAATFLDEEEDLDPETETETDPDAGDKLRREDP